MTEHAPPNFAARLSSMRAEHENRHAYDRGMHFLNNILEARVPNLFAKPSARKLLPLIHGLVNHKNASKLLYEWSCCASGIDIIKHMHNAVQPRVETHGIENVPANGGCILIANHPTGLTDGAALFDSIRHVRQDVAVFVFHDLLSINPDATDAFIPVEWRQQHQSMAKSRKTFRIAHRAFKAGRLVTIFPSGRLSYWNGMRISERPWKDAFVTFARRYNLPIVPVHIHSRNSVLYYCLSMLSATLRDLQSVNEMQNKFQHPFRVTFGKPIFPGQLEGSPVTLASCAQYYVEHVLYRYPDLSFSNWLDEDDPDGDRTLHLLSGGTAPAD